MGLRAQAALGAQFAQACSLLELSYNIGGLEKFVKITRKHLSQNHLLRERETLKQVLFQKFGEVSQNICKRLLLKFQTPFQK